MTMRNFWIDTDVEGRATNLSGGPRAKEGTMTTSLAVKVDGASVTACQINCWHDDEEGNKIMFRFHDGTTKLVMTDDKELLVCRENTNKRNQVMGIVSNKTLTPTQRLKDIELLLRNL